MKKTLTIAGSDTCGGAGIQADLKTFAAHGTYGMSVITAVTVQNTMGVFGCQDIEPEIIAGQIDAIFTDIDKVDAVKIGMVSKIETINVIADKLEFYKPQNIVIDPVMVSKSGFDLMKPESKDTLIKRLIPLATVLTPNLPEAEVITGMKIDNIDAMREAAKKISDMGAKNVFVKGGHLTDDATDVLCDGKKTVLFSGKRINTKNTHGTGCTISSAIASNLANGMNVEEAVRAAKEYTTIAIKHSFAIGKGVGPTNHFYILYKKAGMETD
ncbi:MAG: bifunctional hydroxymethylpyrimidine kinase/phosphomethylpyrimidine kinase [Clostridia bacterium]|jgi:hydroxymethylpyrimidine/phosphomethylpyrimidine kinase|nr:bifunctional hydroxymethylpyrimidine kinase/phosphomethylpyrimidine kinase [Clostridia bacterium]MCI2000745.1 bifunctional hydroxymethylpyrimidine kinase/phosphomethylpyrimidine kinase [Clostridia bacterium]MCI2015463.1 bifunctional hydroxymethylpyrimidine kinase/phosphomethylpyrimidine kinase [Clostridia bacterium]